MTQEGDKIPAPLEFKRVSDTIFVGLRVEWLSGDTGGGLEFNLTAGAGVGSPYLTLTVTLPDGSEVYEVADVRPMVTEMVTRIVTEHGGQS